MSTAKSSRARGLKLAIRALSLIGILAAMMALVPLIIPAAAAGPSAYTAQTPSRLLDTRVSAQTLAAGGSLNLTVAGVAGVPAAASGVVLNTTVTNTADSGFLTVYPAGNPRPLSSNLNYVAGQTVPNLVSVPVGTGGQITIFASKGTDVVVDLEGFFAAPSGSAGGQVALTPARIADTRTASGFAGAGQTLAAGATLNVQATGAGGVPTTGVAAVILNATVTNTSDSGFLTAYPAGAAKPLASNLNWLAGQTVPNRVIVPVGTGGQVSLFNSKGSTDVVVDVTGYFTDATATGKLFTPLSPIRITDTRASAQTLGPAGTLTVQVAGTAGVPTGSTAAVLNVTVTNTTTPGFLTVYPGPTRPTASDLNWAAGQTVPNLVVATLSSTGSVTIFNSAGSTDVVVDVFGSVGVAGGIAGGLTVSATATSVPADGSTTSTITVTAARPDGTPLVADPVLLTTSQSTTGVCATSGTTPPPNLKPAQGNTNASGQFTSTYTSTSTAGTCTISVSEALNGLAGTIVITQTASNTVTVSGAGISPNVGIPADGTTTSTITANVVTGSGAAVSSDAVTFTKSDFPAGACGGLSATSANTDLSGNAKVTYTTTSISGFCSITATEANTSGNDTKDLVQKINAAIPGYTVAFTSPAAVTIKADGTSTTTLTVNVKNTATPPANVAGDPVRLIKTKSAVGTCGTFSSKFGTTDANGNVSITYTSSTTAGKCTITAQDANTASFNTTGTTVTITQTAASVAVTAGPSTVPFGATSTITVTVTDSTGAAVQGNTLSSVTLVGNPATACGTLAPPLSGSPLGTTNASGQVTATYTASSGVGAAGFCTITATEANGGTGSVAILQQAPGTTAASINISANPSSNPADTTEQSLITVTVRTSSGTPFGADPVNLTTSTTGGSCGTLSPSTGSVGSGTLQTTVGLTPTLPNPTGVFTSTYTNSATTGSCTITATESSGGLSASVVITQGAAQNLVTVSATTSPVKADGTSTSTINALIQNPSQAAVSGDAVTFATSGDPAAACGGLSSATPVNSDVNGNAKVTYTASTVSGFCNITATEAGTGGSSLVRLAQTINAPIASYTVAVTSTTLATTLSTALVTTAATTSLSVPALPAAVAAGSSVWLISATSTPPSSQTTVSPCTPPPAPTTCTPITVAALAAAGATTISVTSFTANFAYPVGTTVQLGNQAPTIKADGTSTLTVATAVTNSTGGIVSGNPLRFLRSSGAIDPTGACGKISSRIGTTDSNGLVSITYTSSKVAGLCATNAREANTNARTNTNIAGGTSGGAGVGLVISQFSPNTVTVTASPSSIKASGAATSTITVTVTDSSGAALSGDGITFTLLGNPSCGTLGPSSGTPAGTTNASGQVTVTYTSSTTIGFCSITATEGIASQTGTATVVQTA